MNEKLEEEFLKEIKILIDKYKEYANQEMPYTSIIKPNTIYTNDRYGEALKDTDKKLKDYITSKMPELKEAIKKEVKQKKEEIYNKTQEFINKSRKAIKKEIEEKNKQVQEKYEKLVQEKEKLGKKEEELNTIRKNIKKYKKIDKEIYRVMDTSQQERNKELKQLYRIYNREQEEYNNMKKELVQLEEKLDSFEKTYGKILFNADENVINKLSQIVKEKQEKDLLNKFKIHKMPDDINIVSIRELEEKRKQGKNEKGQDNKIIDEEKRKQEEQMWADYNKKQEEQDKRAQEEIYKKLKEHETELVNAKAESDDEEKKFYEEVEKEIRDEEAKEKFFSNKEIGYEDLLKGDLPYQKLKEKLMSTYTLSQLEKALEKKSLIEIYELYVNQINKDLENSTIIKEVLSEEEMNAKINKKLANEEFKTTLLVRLEMLKEREEQKKEKREQYYKREKEATEFFEDIEKKYGKDILPDIYFKDKPNLISSYAKGENKGLLSSFNLLKYCEEQCEILKEITSAMVAQEGDYVNDEMKDINDLRQKVKGVREKEEELGKIKSHEKTKKGSRLLAKIKNFPPIRNAIENKGHNKYSENLEVDESNRTRTYIKWRNEMDKPYSDFIKRMTKGNQTPKEQASFIEKLKNEPVFIDRNEEKWVK